MPEEVELQVGRRIERRRQLVEVVVEQPRIEPLDLDAALQVLREILPVKGLQRVDPVPDDVPAQDFLVDEGQQDPAGELREIGVLLDQRLRIENHRAVQLGLVHLVENRAAQLRLDLLAVRQRSRPIMANSIRFCRSSPVPEIGVSIRTPDDHHRFLLDLDLRLRLLSPARCIWARRAR